MIGPQLKLTGLSVIGMSTELYGTQRASPGGNNEHILEPVLDIIHLAALYRVDVQRCFREVLEDEDHIELFQAKLDALERGDLNLG